MKKMEGKVIWNKESTQEQPALLYKEFNFTIPNLKGFVVRKPSTKYTCYKDKTLTEIQSCLTEKAYSPFERAFLNTLLHLYYDVLGPERFGFLEYIVKDNFERFYLIYWYHLYKMQTKTPLPHKYAKGIKKLDICNVFRKDFQISFQTEGTGYECHYVAPTRKEQLVFETRTAPPTGEPKSASEPRIV